MASLYICNAHTTFQHILTLKADKQCFLLLCSFYLFKGSVCRIQGDLLAEMKYDSHNYVFISVEQLSLR